GALFGYLWLIDADESLTGADCLAAERCAAEIGTAMYRRDELERPQREHELRLLAQLLGPDAAQHEAAARVLAPSRARHEAPAHERARAELLFAAAGVVVLAVRRSGDPEPELGSAE